MAITILVLFWVLVGLSVFLAAIRGGGRRGPATRQPRSRMAPGARRLTILATTVGLLAFGVVIPALALVHNGTTQSERSKGGVKLTADQEEGRSLFRENCATCHTLAAAKSVGKVGTNLDVLFGRASDAKSIRNNYNLVIDAIAHGRARGQGQMPLQLLQGDDAKNVADYVSHVAGR